MCEVQVPVVDHELWTRVAPENDPLDPNLKVGTATLAHCSPADTYFEVFGGERSYDITTRDCAWATVEQPLLIPIMAGERLYVRLWHFALLPAPVDVALPMWLIGDDVVWSEQVPIPSAARLVIGGPVAERDYPAQSRVRWHISNHGFNSWNVLDLAVVRTQPCSPDAG